MMHGQKNIKLWLHLSRSDTILHRLYMLLCCQCK